MDQCFRGERLRIGIEDDVRAAHFRRRVERLRLQRQENARRCVEADEEGQVTVGFVAGSGHEAVRDFFLQHENRAAAVRVGHDAAQDRRAGVVGKIADGTIRTRRQRRLHGIVVDERDAIAVLFLQPFRKLRIDLDRDQLVGQLGQFLGQHSLAGTDLDHDVIRRE